MSADITPEQWAEAEKTAPTFTDVVVGDSAEVGSTSLRPPPPPHFTD